MLIYVLRHGITRWNKLKKVQGAVDIPLAPEGIELAKTHRGGIEGCSL